MLTPDLQLREQDDPSMCAGFYSVFRLAGHGISTVWEDTGLELYSNGDGIELYQQASLYSTSDFLANIIDDIEELI